MWIIIGSGFCKGNAIKQRVFDVLCQYLNFKDARIQKCLEPIDLYIRFPKLFCKAFAKANVNIVYCVEEHIF